MKVYLAKDWTGVHVFKDIPRLEKCGNLPPIWSGHRLKFFNIEGSFVADEIPRGQYIEREIWWSIIKRIG